MRPLSRIASFALLALLLCLLPTVWPNAHSEKLPLLDHERCDARQLRATASLIGEYHGSIETYASSETSSSDQTGGIKEDIPSKYKARYAKWKQEFLSTDIGQKQWANYDHNPNFTLTITVSDDNAKGAATGKYKWDSSGQLIAATITLGIHIDQGFPNPIYYPVMNSLSLMESSGKIDQEILAATKIAHEFGHVNRTAKVDPTLYQRQIQLIPVYNKILLSNGRDVSDPRLAELVKQLGGTPVEIWEDREYWGETNAMLYIRDKFKDDNLRCSMFSRIKHSVDLYASTYEDRFLKIVQSMPSSNKCGWE